MIGRTSTRAFIRNVNNNSLPNCPVTANDFLATEKIFDPDIGSLKGKTVRSSSDRVEIMDNVADADIMSQYRDVVLAGDIMFINRMSFFVTI
jgi:hypothetical protein